jgi:hypothetical protein
VIFSWVTRTALGSPLVPLVKKWREDVKAVGPRRALALARMGTGTMVMLTAADLAERGVITGNGPDDPGERQNLTQQGRLPYSMRIGDRWYQYNRFDPFGMTLGLVADFIEMIKRRDIEPEEVDEVNEIVAGVIASIARTTLSRTYLDGISQFVDMLDKPEAYAADYIKGFLASFASQGMYAIKRGVDPVVRDPNTLME